MNLESYKSLKLFQNPDSKFSKHTEVTNVEKQPTEIKTPANTVDKSGFTMKKNTKLWQKF